VSFATELEKHVARLGIAETCKALGISRRTLETWRYGQPPREVIQIGAIAILSRTQTK
jgi:hypothetical protein